jgi:AcrR family transcriptional regulator
MVRTAKKPAVKSRTRAPPRRDAGRARGATVTDAVLDRTLDELVTAGVGQLSVDRIARAAEVNKTSVYRRWPTREALIAAALERVLGDLTLAQADTGTLRGDLLHLGASVAALLERPAGKALARAVFAEPEAPSIAALARQQLEASASAPAVAMVARAMARGEWREGADPMALMAMLVGAILHRVMFERHEPSRAWLEGVVDITLRGVKT